MPVEKPVECVNNYMNIHRKNTLSSLMKVEAMLKIYRNLRELDFRRLMTIYEEGNRENGQERYPELPEVQQILRAEQDFYQYLRECFFPTEGAFYAVWEKDGQYVAALRLEPYQDGLLLEALETRPDMRRKGYAKTLIRSVLEATREIRVYSHVSKRNLPSLRAHCACGFEIWKDYAVYADGSVLRNSYTLCREP